MFRVQSNVIVTRLRQRSLHSAQNLKRYFEARIFSPLQTLCHRPATKFSGRPAPAAQFIATRVPFSKQEREPWVARKVQKVFSVGELIVLMLLTEQIRIKTMNS